MATGDALSRGEPIGNLDESAADALVIASGDVQNAFRHMGSPLWLRSYFCVRSLTARAFGMTGKIVQGSRVSAEQTLFPALLTLPMGLPGACACGSMWAPSGELCGSPLGLPAITGGGPPIVVGTNRSVGFRWYYADKVGAVSKGATLTARYFDGLCDSFRRVGCPVHEVASAALSAETLGVRIISAHGVCGHTDSRIFISDRHGAFLMHRRRVSGRVVQPIAGHLSLGAVASRGALSVLHSVYKYAAKHWWDSLKRELRTYAGLLSLF